MYTSVNLCYGAIVPSDAFLGYGDNKELAQELIDQKGSIPGLHLTYGFSDEPYIFIGVEISGFDAVEPFALEDLTTEPTDQEKTEAQSYIDKLDDKFKAILSPIKVWLIPSES